MSRSATTGWRARAAGRPTDFPASPADLLAIDGLRARPAGRIVLVGAGPGDPDLLTVKAARTLVRAEVVVYDGLVDPRILALAPPSAEMISVAKARAHHTMAQSEINALLVARAREGRVVVRLKGGDPFVFGRGGEEVEAAREAGIAVEVIPGVTAALGCAAESLLPLTHRDHASAVTFVAGQCKGLAEQDWRGLAGDGRTLVIYMGISAAAAIADKLVADGLSPQTPAAVLEGGTRPDARTFRTTLAALPATLEAQAVRSPALLVVGAVAALAVERPGVLAPFVPSALNLALAAE